ncbi:DEAD/DEAH box helicase [Pelagibaculum spongiae]|uniref:ATP-dependent RNA helicase DeaD n=1 Tax=Pelagibaculum spongiae TaxID=2080658 RepID=A0A2V1GZC1_9GAMM|nr:DEAD/DEAH box helicase [Pelagibaculum spongiae]PVZ71789.1 ATP-dependent RNA helicase [Pelagibaculum spongiae]
MSESSSAEAETCTFDQLGLSEPVLKALTALGYETPSPIQAESIPALLTGGDLLGQAQTGTGKTAAFALPLLETITDCKSGPAALVLTPTRELAIQVAEAFQSYAKYMRDFHVLPIYGGAGYTEQLRSLRRGVHVVVGTPGRVMDHIRRGSLDLSGLKTLVLDEADEMLRMGFIDDVEWILEQTPKQRQIALFSATMPHEIKRVADKYLTKPREIRIKQKTATASTVRQRYWQVGGLHKLDALTRVLETEACEGIIIFVRTRTMTVELAEKLSARGYACEALNGDIAQKLRERTVERLKAGKLDILVATDVAARGLDVERISHVINYDIPADTESYIHRIGRTGRAGRSGQAILFVAHRERYLLRAIERATRQPIERMEMPSADDINVTRKQRFQQRISEVIASQDLEVFDQLIGETLAATEVDPVKVAAALAYMAQGDQPLFVEDKPFQRRDDSERRERRDSRDGGRDSNRRQPREPSEPGKPVALDPKARPLKGRPEVEMNRYRLDVGYSHGVKPGNIVGAVANEGEVDSSYIGHIEIYSDFSTIDLPANLDEPTLEKLTKARVCQQKLGMGTIKEGDVGLVAPRPARRTGGDRDNRGERRGPPRRRPQNRDRS